jgi:hypothetical protein
MSSAVLRFIKIGEALPFVGISDLLGAGSVGNLKYGIYTSVSGCCGAHVKTDGKATHNS